MYAKEKKEKERESVLFKLFAVGKSEVLKKLSEYPCHSSSHKCSYILLLQQTEELPEKRSREVEVSCCLNSQVMGEPHDGRAVILCGSIISVLETKRE